MSSADWFIEFPTHRDGSIRGLALYLGEIPQGAGPVHSARVVAMSLREVFDSALVCWGVREERSASVRAWIKEYHKELRTGGRYVYPLVDLIDPKHLSNFDWKYENIAKFVREDGHRGPFHLQVDVRGGVQAMAQQEGKARPFLFSDTGTLGSAQAEQVVLPYREEAVGSVSYVPEYVYDAKTGLYTRYMNGKATVEGLAEHAGRAAQFANVILLRTEITWENAAAAVIELVGQGACDIFIGGTHQRGVWVRAGAQKAMESNSLDARLIFLDEDGNELVLRRGSTALLIMDKEQDVWMETGE